MIGSIASMFIVCVALVTADFAANDELLVQQREVSDARMTSLEGQVAIVLSELFDIKSEVTSLRSEVSRIDLIESAVADVTFNFQYFVNERYTSYGGKDCYGNDIDLWIVTKNSCLAKCMEMIDCIAVVFEPHAGRCWRKRVCDTSNFLSSPAKETHIKPTYHGYTSYAGKDCRGNDIGELNLDKDSCLTKCTELKDCIAVVYEPTTKKCWRKRACDGSILENDSNKEIFFKPAFKGYQRYAGQDCFGNDIDMLNLDRNSCLTKCTELVECIAVVYKPSTNECWRKRVCDSSNLITKPDRDTFFKPAFQGYKIYEGKDCFGNDIDALNLDRNSCLTKCTELVECIAVVYKPSTNECWRKRVCDSSNFRIRPDRDTFFKPVF